MWLASSAALLVHLFSSVNCTLVGISMCFSRERFCESSFADGLPGWCELPIMCSLCEQPVRRDPDSTWQHDMYENFLPAAPSSGRGVTGGIETGTKLYISNLDYGVSNDDIKVTPHLAILS